MATPTVLSIGELLHLLDDPEWLEAPLRGEASPLAAVGLDGDGGEVSALAGRRPPASRVLVGLAGSHPAPPALLDHFDLLLCSDGDEAGGWIRAGDTAAALERLADAISTSPFASTALVQLLRLGPGLSLADAVIAESAVYSMLLAGPEFRRWLRDLPPQRAPDTAWPVALGDNGTEILVTLNRPEVRNAFNTAMRDALVDLLRLLERADDTRPVVLRGRGPVFCSGGDLSEFGLSSDPGEAHAIRVARSCGLALAGLGARSIARVHGSCVGAGVEIPAFCARVEAHPQTGFRLPEIAMGLIPGAGGTAALPRRIGRARTAWLALSGEEIDAERALRWGLIDAINRDS